MKKIIFLFSSLFFCHSIIAQISIGIRAEPIFYIQKENIVHLSIPKSETIKHSPKANIILCAAFTVDAFEDVSLSLRPGFVIGELYGGIDTGLYSSIYVSKKYYLLAGINIHNNGGSGGNTKVSRNVNINYLALGGGQKLGKNGFFEIQFNYPFNQPVFGYINSFEGSPVHSVSTGLTIPWCLKISFGVEWEL